MRKIFACLLLLCNVSVYAQRHDEAASFTRQLQLASQQTVLLNNKAGRLPISGLLNVHAAVVHFNTAFTGIFDSIANKYTSVSSFTAQDITDSTGFFALHDALKLYNLVILCFSGSTNYGTALWHFVKELEEETPLIIVLEGAPQQLKHFSRFTSPMLWCEADTQGAASFTAQAIFGGKPVAGRLSKDYGTGFKKGSGFKTNKTRLGYGTPEAVSIPESLPQQIDSLVTAGIAAHAAPAVVILVARRGEVIFHRAYGTHTYNGNQYTQADDIFDMASVTKVTATTPSVMRLIDQRKIHLDSPISRYIAVTRTIPDKRDIKVKEALLHEAGYTPYIKFFELLKPGDMSTDSSAAHPTKVADHYFLRANFFRDVMWPVTLQSKVETRGQYVYSDVSMYMIKEVVEQATHRKLNEYVAEEFYNPLGMRSTGFLPRDRFNKSRIVPTTENDNWFRNMLVQGYVNDPGSAMAGGVEGHAGLFSNANDLAIYYQMLFNKGTYGGRRYITAKTVEQFTSRQSKISGRGYGFVKVTPGEMEANRGYPSPEAFGHTGYTGTYVWVDPVYEFVYVCLTNRTYPDDNKTFGVSKINIRTSALDLLYRAVLDTTGKSASGHRNE